MKKLPRKHILSLCLACCFSMAVFAQQVTFKVKNVTVKTAVIKFKKATGYSFVFGSSKVDTNKKISINANNQSLREVVGQILVGQNLDYEINGKFIIVKKRKQSEQEGRSPQKSNSVIKASGIIKDKNNDPIIGATVMQRGTSNGTVTDVNGHYALDVPAGSILEVSYVGYRKSLIKAGINKSIILNEDSKILNEIVVTALGIKKEAKALSYNVQQVNGSDVMKVSDANFVNNLNGKIAGVTINSSSSGIGGSSRVVMRGAKSIDGNNNVLYVIDGIPMPDLQHDQPTGIYAGAGQTGDAASSLNSDDIKSISILSGPSAAALYGSDAANGVILITTKQGTIGHLDVNYTGSFQFSHPFVMPKFQNTYGPSETGSYYSWGSKLSKTSSYNPEDFYQTGKNYTHSVNVSSGTKNDQTYMSLGATDAEGIIHNNDYDRYNLSIRNTSKFLNDKMTLDLSYMLSSIKEQNMISQGLYFNPIVGVYLFPAGDDWNKVTYFERYNADRNFPVQYWPYGDNGLSMQNPYWITERDKFINHKVRNMATASLKWEPEKWIFLTGRVKYDNSAEHYEKKFSASTNTLFASKYGRYALNHENSRQLYAEAFAMINKYFNHDIWNLTSTIGASFDQRDYDQDGFDGNLKGVANLFTLSNVATSESNTKFTQTGYTTRKEAVYGSAQLGYKGSIYLDVTARNDWSSKLNADNNSYFYYSAGLSDVVTDMFPVIKSNIMPYFKIRISYSEVGNDPNEAFLTNPTYKMSTTYPETSTQMRNPDLKPERTKSWEGGFDFVFFNNKLKLNATLYHSRTYNQFFTVLLPASSGYTSVIVNAGRVDNKGIEFTAHFNENLGSVLWESYLTWTLNRNKIKELLRGWKNPIDGNVYSLTELDMGGTSGYKMKLIEGGTLSDIYVSTLKTDEHGAVYVDPVSQTVVAENNNYVKAGSASPKYNLGWGNNFSWKGFSLGFLFTYRVGGIVVSETQAVMDAFGVSKASAKARDNGGALINGRFIPAQSYYQTVGSTSGNIDSQYVYSATNLRLSELSFGYAFPVNKLVPWIKGIDVSFVAHNLWMIYNKAPFDPELTANTGTYFQGIDYFMQPSLRTMGFSVKLHF